MSNENNMEICQSDLERFSRSERLNLFESNPLPASEILNNLGLFINAKNLSRILFLNHIYRLSVNVPGIVMDFGTRYGQNLSLFCSMRGIYEPFNKLKKIVGFDTFSGFTAPDAKDSPDSGYGEGGLATVCNYEVFLEKLMLNQEQDNPLSHVKKFEIVKGDVCDTLPNYLEKHPETIVSLAYFDMDIYKPTYESLKLIKERLVKGSVIGFDELNDPLWPGETLALCEVFGLNKIALKRYPYASRVSYFVYD